MTILPQSPSNGKPVALYLCVSGEEQADTITNQRDFLDDGVSGVIPLHRRSEGVRLVGGRPMRAVRRGSGAQAGWTGWRAGFRCSWTPTSA